MLDLIVCPGAYIPNITAVKFEEMLLMITLWC